MLAPGPEGRRCPGWGSDGSIAAAASTSPGLAGACSTLASEFMEKAQNMLINCPNALLIMGCAMVIYVSSCVANEKQVRDLLLK